MNVVVDAGNTRIKYAFFDQDRLLETKYREESLLEDVLRWKAKGFSMDVFLSGSGKIPEGLVALLKEQADFCVEASPLMEMPLKIGYDTPGTLGFDRIAACTGALKLFPGCPLLVIDSGTCITFNYVSAEGIFLGGNISPGMQMRFRALHQFTGRLPLVQREGRELPMGKDTETAIRAGVLKGMEYEISGYIVAMKHKYPELLVFLTGGDDFSFDTNLKSIIFADRFLVLKGLNRILNYNNDKI